MTLAGELVPHRGSIEKQNGISIALATQDPWIMNGSVRENILMGLPFDEVSYNEIVKACSLDVDFGNFIDGDNTLVGDRGVQCSGGQVSTNTNSYGISDVLWLSRLIIMYCSLM